MTRDQVIGWDRLRRAVPWEVAQAILAIAALPSRWPEQRSASLWTAVIAG